MALLTELYATENQCGEAFRTAVNHAYFEEGVNIGQLENILALGESVGLNRQHLAAHLQTADSTRLAPAQQLAKVWSVSAVPTFIVAEEFKIVGSDQDQALVDAIEMVMKRQ